MKLPNFRLYDTQAKAALIFGIVGIFCIAALTVFVFRNFSWAEKEIYYNSKQGFGKYRPYLVQGTTAISVVIGFAAGMLGFNSLGQKRNNKQSFSWMGLLMGTLSVSLAVILLYAWRTLSATVITG